MAAQVKESMTKLKVHCQKEEDGIKKTRIITINNINPEATNDKLFLLAGKISNLVEDTQSKVVRADDKVLAEI